MKTVTMMSAPSGPVSVTPGICQPPKKSVVTRPATMIDSMKSVIKNIRNFMPPYLTKGMFRRVSSTSRLSL